jgi:hypothetical protein
MSCFGTTDKEVGKITDARKPWGGWVGTQMGCREAEQMNLIES